MTSGVTSCQSLGRGNRGAIGASGAVVRCAIMHLVGAPCLGPQRQSSAPVESCDDTVPIPATYTRSKYHIFRYPFCRSKRSPVSQPMLHVPLITARTESPTHTIHTHLRPANRQASTLRRCNTRTLCSRCGTWAARRSCGHCGGITSTTRMGSSSWWTARTATASARRRRSSRPSCRCVRAQRAAHVLSGRAALQIRSPECAGLHCTGKGQQPSMQDARGFEAVKMGLPLAEAHAGWAYVHGGAWEHGCAVCLGVLHARARRGTTCKESAHAALTTSREWREALPWTMQPIGWLARTASAARYPPPLSGQRLATATSRQA